MESDCKLINQSEVNKLLATYASKAVEFDFIKTVKNNDMNQSYQSDAQTETQQEFTVPVDIPDKLQWVPDNQVKL